MVAKSAKVVMRWKLQSAARCMDAWGELTTEEVRKRQVTVKIVQRMCNKCISAAIERWCANVDDLKMQHAEEERKQHLLNKIVSRFLNRAVGAAFERWRDHTVQEKQVMRTYAFAYAYI